MQIALQPDVESAMRPLFSFPKWDGKLVLAGFFIIGYYALVLIMAWRPLPTSNASLVHDAIATLGPVVGLIFGALFRTTGAEERNAVLRSADLQAAISAPPAATPAPEALADSVASGVKRALAEAEPGEVHPNLSPGVSRPLAADGVRRDWLDQPETPAPAKADVAPGATPVLED
jgi:hypothetical protein